MNNLQTRSINKSIFLLKDPLKWVGHSGSRPTLDSPLFVQLKKARPGVMLVSLVDIKGTLYSNLTSEEAREVEFEEISMESWDIAKEHLNKKNPTAAFLEIARNGSLSQEDDCPWDEFLEVALKDRFEASAWFERDRASLCLTENISRKSIVELIDDDVKDAIESGYLSSPSTPRPKDSDWMAPLVAYAQSQGLIDNVPAYRKPVATERER